MKKEYIIINEFLDDSKRFLHLSQYRGISYVKVRGQSEEHASIAVSDIEEMARILLGVGCWMPAGSSAGSKTLESSLEIEAKIGIPCYEFGFLRVRGLGAEHIKSVKEVNTILDTPENCLKRQGCLLRIRETDSKKHGESVKVTYKGPKVNHSGLKIRPEHEVSVWDGDVMNLFILAGFQERSIYHKIRNSYSYLNSEICLDVLLENGKCYIEIEGPEAEVWDIRNRLGLDDLPLITEGYADLVKRK